MENLATAFPQVDNILQCCSGLSALTRFLIISADVASYESPAAIMGNLATPIPQGDNILQCFSRLSSLTRFLIISADVASYESGG